MAEYESNPQHHSFLHDQTEIPGLFFRDEKVSYQEAMINDIILEKQPFDYDVLSPTPLDPFHLKTSGTEYYHAARMLVENRLNSVADKHRIPDHIRELMMHEVEIEHEHRSHKNNEGMREYRKAYPEDEMLDRETANEIVAARAGVSTLGRLATILANVPKIGGIEVMKFTFFLNNREMVRQHATFISRIRMTEMRSDGAFSVPDCRIEMAKPSIIDTSDNVGPHIIAFKGKEADIEVNGRQLELMGRYSYVALDGSYQIDGVEPANVPVGDRTANVQSVSMSKYLRIPK